jgi:hypothetical protein
MTPEEIQQKIKDIITNHIRASEDPSASDQVTADLHSVLTAKMRDKVLGQQEPSNDDTDEDFDVGDDVEDFDDETQE